MMPCYIEANLFVAELALFEEPIVLFLVHLNMWTKVLTLS